MSEDLGPLADVTAFLRGDRPLLEEVRAAVEGVVRSFHAFDAELHGELVQDSIARLVVSLSHGRFRGDSSLKTYAQQVARHACLEQLRARRSGATVDPEAIPSQADWSTPEGELIRSEEHRRNLRLLARLPAESLELLRLIFEERLSYREIAERLGLSEGAIKSRVHRLRLASRDGSPVVQRRKHSTKPPESGGPRGDKP